VISTGPQVGAGISSTSLRLLLRASPNLLEISIGLGAEINDEDVAFIAATCPLLQRAHFSFSTVSDAGDSNLLLQNEPMEVPWPCVSIDVDVEQVRGIRQCVFKW
jgi:hypothetical protein